DVSHRLTDALKVGLLLRVGVEIVLHVVLDLIFGLILKAGVEPVHVRVSEQVGRERRRNTSRDTGYVRSCAVGRPRRRIIRGCPRGSTYPRAGNRASADRADYHPARNDI